MAADQETNRRRMKQLMEKPGNGTCADCGAAGPEWASYTLGVFVCQCCSGLHRNISQISKVKSVLLDPWSTSEVEFMDSVGNSAGQAKYQQIVPAFYYQPTHKDCTLLREQWIRAKYERKEFLSVDRQEPYSAVAHTVITLFLYKEENKVQVDEWTDCSIIISGYREGFLWKRGRDNGQYLSRNFILTEKEGVLKYFNKHDAREPKAIMTIDTVNATFQPAKIGTATGLQITYLKDNSTRNIFVYHEDGKEMVDWFNAIRAVRFHYLQVAFPGSPQSELLPKLTRNYIQEGYMEKTGPKHTEGFKKRWFTMDERRLMYFKDPLDAYARGEVFIGSNDNNYTVLPGLPPNIQGNRWQFGITIVTPDRKFLFACETEEEQKDWMTAFQIVVNRPMLPQEFAVEAYFKHKP